MLKQWQGGYYRDSEGASVSWNRIILHIIDDDLNFKSSTMEAITVCLSAGP